ncbi:MAG: discoidin domain-containing protein [Peptococcaceae bacterium]|nr:discoidin domain-containing protein [Peptococcaceae bacterium]
MKYLDDSGLERVVENLGESGGRDGAGLLIGDVLESLTTSTPSMTRGDTTWLKLNGQSYDPSDYPNFEYSNVKQIIPTMTSAAAPTPNVVTASGEASATYAAWRAFSGAANSWRSAANTFTSGNGYTGNQWVQIDLGKSVMCTGYGLAQIEALTTGSAPATWQLLGSNNNATWDVIDSRENWTSSMWGSINTVIPLQFPAAVTYRYWRLSITKICSATSGGTIAYVSLRDFQLFSPLLPDRTTGNYYVRVSGVDVPADSINLSGFVSQAQFSAHEGNAHGKALISLMGGPSLTTVAPAVNASGVMTACAVLSPQNTILRTVSGGNTFSIPVGTAAVQYWQLIPYEVKMVAAVASINNSASVTGPANADIRPFIGIAIPNPGTLDFQIIERSRVWADRGWASGANSTSTMLRCLDNTLGDLPIPITIPAGTMICVVIGLMSFGPSHAALAPTVYVNGSVVFEPV